MAGLSGVVAVDGGPSGAYARTADGTLLGWGDTTGTLWDDTAQAPLTRSSRTPQVVRFPAGYGSVVSAVMGYRYSVGLFR